MPRAILWITALVFAGFGAAFVVVPDWLAAQVDIRLASPTARVDFVATYGGLELGLAGFLALCARRGAWLEAGLTCAALALAGFGAVRLLGIAAAHEVRPLLYTLVALESAGAALCLWGAHRVRTMQA